MYLPHFTSVSDIGLFISLHLCFLIQSIISITRTCWKPSPLGIYEASCSWRPFTMYDKVNANRGYFTFLNDNFFTTKMKFRLNDLLGLVWCQNSSTMLSCSNGDYIQRGNQEAKQHTGVTQLTLLRHLWFNFFNETTKHQRSLPVGEAFSITLKQGQELM